MPAHSTRATLEEVADGEGVEVTVYGQLCRKRLLSRGLIFGDLLLEDKTLLNFMVRSADGWLTKEDVVQLKFAMHLGDFLTAEGRLERTPSTNELLFVLRSCTIDVSWASIHPDVPYVSMADATTFFTKAEDGSTQTNMVKLQGQNACKYYFNNASCVRGSECQFFHGKPEDYNALRKEWLEKRLQLKRIVSSIDGDVHDPAEKKLKSARARIFCDWILETFNPDHLRNGSGIVDVAGGRGDICFELWTKRGIPTTLVEPRPRKPRKEHFKYQDDEGRGLAPQIEAILDDALARSPQVFGECSLVVGMHPDEATEAIVDAALALNKPFAVVPCCVMSRLFPNRTLADGTPVATYDVFVRYLQAKDPAIQSTFLPFAGKNQVLFKL
ncbi:unnamed protein product [Aphanomyces euteiches]|uniref:C3H1-type domain-containing protein n=1 Tax=Aphanomyces euteiches TaxID=100861 RepID=A0A6G0WF32_9STRA|nr:hypothetical protein Ae201684_015963 [Aphanomyces euteiches]KAH9088344.1 hypothetical protein Ae201684P_003038 [Aphanomyces euteiches]